MPMTAAKMHTPPPARRRAVAAMATLIALGWGLGAAAQQEAPVSLLGAAGDQPKVAFETAWSADGVRPGGQAALAIIMDIADGWHVQLHKPSKSWLIPTELKFETLPRGVIFGDLQYPEPHPIEVDFGEGPEVLNFYSGRAVIFARASVAADVEPGEYPIQAAVQWQACDDRSCLAPETTQLDLTLRIVEPAMETRSTHADLFAGYTGRGDPAETSLNIPFFGWDFDIDPTKLWLLLPLAAIGGFFLNLTPCVLPLIPIKIIGLSQAAENRRRCFLLGLMMSLGVTVFWLALGVAIAFVSGFTAANQLFQYPSFTIAVGVVIAVMSLGMLGMYAVRLPQWVYRINPRHDTLHGSFGFGIMAAVLSTPCTAPFMGAAAAWSATQTPPVTLATFAAIGIGMAMPYAVLSAFPALIDRMPRTGPASELIKQVMGLLLLAAAAYFLGTGLSGMLVTPPDPPSRLYWWVVALLTAAAGLWLAWRTVRITRVAGKRAVFITVGLAILAVSAFIGLRMTDSGPVNWIHYTPDRLAQAQRSNKVVVLEFTAEWCLNCHALEQGVLFRPQVAAALNAPEVAPIKVDITGNNEAGNRKLLEVGRRTIPLLIVYGRDGEEVFRSDAYTPAQVLDALSRARGDTGVRTAESERPRP